MQMLFEYMIKVSAGYFAAYLFYRLLLSRLTSYKSNRFYLLITSVLALVFPLLRLDMFISPQTIARSGFINHMPSWNITAAANEYIPAESQGNILSVIITAFVCGVIVCLTHFIMQLLSFKKITGNAKLISQANGIKLYQLDKDVMPFSFGNSIFINSNRHTAGEMREIIRHESVHVYQQHTIDVIIAEITCMLNWYNPFAWLTRQAIKQNLEYLADDTVIKEGADKKSYQYLLLKVTGHSPLPIASNFTLSSLKQRIYMMNKVKTSQKHLLKLLFVLPIVAFMMVAFRDDTPMHTMQTNILATDDSYMLSKLTYNIPDTKIDILVKHAQDKSLLQAGKPFTLSIIKRERDRLKTLLEKNGYNNISNNAISFLIDSTLTDNRFAIQVNIDVKRMALLKGSNKSITDSMATANSAGHRQAADENTIPSRNDLAGLPGQSG